MTNEHVAEPPVRHRSCLIVGNWKMYKTIDQALSFLKAIIPIAEDIDCKVWLSVPFTAIQPCADMAKSSKVVIGAQNMNDAKEGAFTGEISPLMLIDLNIKYVLVGHSERPDAALRRDRRVRERVPQSGGQHQRAYGRPAGPAGQLRAWRAPRQPHRA